jgi:hypothetical protein
MELKQVKARTVLLQWFAITGEFLGQGNYTSLVETMPLVCEQVLMLAQHGKRFGLAESINPADTVIDCYVVIMVLDGVNVRVENEPFVPTLPPDYTFKPHLLHVNLMVIPYAAG